MDNNTEHNSSREGPVAALVGAILKKCRYSLAKDRSELSPRDGFMAASLAVRDMLVDRLIATEDAYRRADAKRVYYLSMEFLIGRLQENNLCNLGLFDLWRTAMAELGIDPEAAINAEPDAALGNGGLGRLAACYLDSLATLGIPGFGYGINYEFGFFKQAIKNGQQIERPDNWQTLGTPWLIERLEEYCIIPVYGRVEHSEDRDGNYNPMWLDWKVIVGVPHDMPIVGYGGKTVNFLRLYSARASNEFDMQIFNEGDYLRAVQQKLTTETISKVLYPSDSIEAGRELRLIQEYFLVACAVRDIVRRYLKDHTDFTKFSSKVAMQLNDTHPALTVVELMRLLIDEHSVPWEWAWNITQQTLGYTNHTLMPEALEKWPVSLIESVLPRHMQIIYEINRRFLDEVKLRRPDDAAVLGRVSLIEETPRKQVRMANLAIVGSHSVNGVAAIHSELVKTNLVPDFYALWPERFNNKTNGVTQRRWLLVANPKLAELIRQTTGDQWITDLNRLRELEPHAKNDDFRRSFLDVKRANKLRLAKVIREQVRVVVDPDSLFDVQIKRIHEYKRQLLNVMHVVHDFLRLTDDGHWIGPPRTYVFAGKAAPGYWAAKQIIKLIHAVAKVVNNDPRAKEAMKVVYLPDYRVSLAESIIPAADLSEQISTAGTEASGTGNMKFALNGALTIGTMDGANIEIREEVGADNIFIFGLLAHDIEDLRRNGSYRSWDMYHRSPAVRKVMDAFAGNLFCADEPGAFKWIFESLLDRNDHYFHLADFESYLTAHDHASRLFMNRPAWAEKAILNTARIGKFSSDRAIAEYAAQIWNVAPVHGSLPTFEG